jgi:hypothetical protein
LEKSERNREIAASQSGMDAKTARKYRGLKRVPSELPVKPRGRRADPFAEVWGEVRDQLEINAGLEAKTMFEYLQRRYPGRFQDGQLRTLQRHQEDYFQWETYLAFLEQVAVPAFYRRCHRIYLIQDNASYHKKQETHDWFKANRRYVEVFQLPPYWPELNATERIWNYTRKHVTHNRFFERPQDLCNALFHNFDYVRHHPQEIENLLHPFF